LRIWANGYRRRFLVDTSPTTYPEEEEKETSIFSSTHGEGPAGAVGAPHVTAYKEEGAAVFALGDGENETVIVTETPAAAVDTSPVIEGEEVNGIALTRNEDQPEAVDEIPDANALCLDGEAPSGIATLIDGQEERDAAEVVGRINDQGETETNILSMADDGSDIPPAISVDHEYAAKPGGTLLEDNIASIANDIPTRVFGGEEGPEDNQGETTLIQSVSHDSDNKLEPFPSFTQSASRAQVLRPTPSRPPEEGPGDAPADIPSTSLSAFLLMDED
jgi:hypothetical protein